MIEFAPEMKYIQGEGIQWSRNGTGTAAQSTVTGRTHLRNDVRRANYIAPV